MHLSLDPAHGELDDFREDRVPYRYVRLRPQDEHSVCRMGSGTADSFEEIIDALPEHEPCWVLCHFSFTDADGDAVLEPLILSWAPPTIRSTAGAQLVLGARDIALYFPHAPAQILLTRRMTHEDVAHFLRSRPEARER